MSASIAPAYDIACSCGGRLRGQRLARHQVALCPACGEPRFILPQSVLPSPSSRTAAPRRRSMWPRFLVAGIAVAALGVAIVLAIRLHQGESTRRGQGAGEPPSPMRLEALAGEADAAIDSGAYLRASERYAAALAMSEQLARPAPERRRLTQRYRQAALLADLLTESPAEILRHVAALPEMDGQELFHRRYAGRALVLDDTISREAGGRYQHAFHITFPGGAARIDLGALRLLHEIPLGQSQRMLLGLRLAGVHREVGGWVVAPDPDSGVLLTDAAMFAGLSLGLDAEIREVLRRQQAWLDLP